MFKRVRAYKSGDAQCHLCLQEKLCILNAEKRTLLNKRSELLDKCRHRKQILCSKLQNRPESNYFNRLMIGNRRLTVKTQVMYESIPSASIPRAKPRELIHDESPAAGQFEQIPVSRPPGHLQNHKKTCFVTSCRPFPTALRSKGSFLDIQEHFFDHKRAILNTIKTICFIFIQSE